MARNVFIFGAGASRFMGAPLMSDFLDRAEAVRYQFESSITVSAFDRVLRLVHSDLEQLHAKSAVTLDNIETVFGIVEMGTLVGRLPGTPADELENAARDFRTVLAETIECTCFFPVQTGVNDDSPYDRLIMRTCRPGMRTTNAEDAAFLTFNYDIGFDLALSNRRIPVDYALPDSKNGVPLLKLHGSFHWAQCGDASTVLPISLSRVQNEASPVIRRPVTNEQYRLYRPSKLLWSGHVCPGSTAVVGPAIVPPSWNKTQYHRVFQRIWKRAAAELADARTVFIIGYSAQGADSFFRDLLALGVAGNAELRRVVIVDPTAEAYENIRSSLGPVLSRTCEHVKMPFELWASNGGFRFFDPPGTSNRAGW